MVLFLYNEVWKVDGSNGGTLTFFPFFEGKKAKNSDKLAYTQHLRFSQPKTKLEQLLFDVTLPKVCFLIVFFISYWFTIINYE